ncbi:uncharacterized protein LOC143461678 isoform X1 [Clavelina lepadiformis]|uniref:uncharacterized protein LOC143461678 isoform X1 n=2 Tax=Clavelina lepadiformis TaxID=159417 RepID=UPI0040417904
MQDMESQDQTFSQMFEKAGRRKNKKQKFGCIPRSGATYRRNKHTSRDFFRGGHCKEFAILKHVALPDDGTWDESDLRKKITNNSPLQAETSIDFDDGAMQRSHLTRVSSKRGRGIYSPISRKSTAQPQHSGLVYSMNKKKRWLLPEMIEDKIKSEIRKDNFHKESPVYITMIEREIGPNAHHCGTNKADAVRCVTSEKSHDRTYQRKSCRTPKQGRYAWSTELLGLSQSRKKDEFSSSDDEKEHNNPQVIYEICRPKPPDRHSSYLHSPNLNTMERWKPRHKSKNKMFHLTQDNWDENSFEVQTAHDSYNENYSYGLSSKENKCGKRQLGSWINVAKIGIKINNKHKEKNQNVDFSEEFSMKGRKYYTVIQKDNSNDSSCNRVNIKELEKAAEHHKSIFRKEQENSIWLNISTPSFQSLDNAFHTKSNTFYGLKVSKAACRPVKYGIHLRHASKTEVDSCVSKNLRFDAILVLESLSNPNDCQRRDVCYARQSICDCSKSINVKVKAVVLSEKETPKKIGIAWTKCLQTATNELFPGCNEVDVQNLITLAENQLEVTVAAMLENVKFSNKKLACVAKSSTHTSKNTYVNQVGKKVAKMIDLRYSSDQENSCVGFIPKSPDPESEDNYVKIVNSIPCNFCGICDGALSDSKTLFQATALNDCNHWFCVECWRQHVSYSVQQNSQDVQCPAFECTVKVDLVVLMTYLPGDVLSKYQRHKKETKALLSGNVYMCPKCRKLVQLNAKKLSQTFSNASRSLPIPLFCTCGHGWCACCFECPHWPASCKAAALYRKEAAKYAKLWASTKFITEISGKRCPMCTEPIEKFGGCQMMSCVCGHHFCWICLQPYSACLYSCKVQATRKETWDFSRTSESFFSSIVRDLTENHNNCYNSKKILEARRSCCSKASYRMLSFSKSCTTFCATVYQQIDFTRKVKSKFEAILLICDALHCIAEYASVMVCCDEPASNQKRRALQQMLIQMKCLVANMECSIFNYNPKRHGVDLDELLSQHNAAAHNIICMLQRVV